LFSIVTVAVVVAVVVAVWVFVRVTVDGVDVLQEVVNKDSPPPPAAINPRTPAVLRNSLLLTGVESSLFTPIKILLFILFLRYYGCLVLDEF